MTLTLDLARRAGALQFSDLPERAVNAARVSLGDALATMLAAVRLEPATAPFHALAAGSGPGPSTLLAGGSAQPGMAALANGALAHALDFEDTFDPAGLHPNAALVPAVLALAEAEGASGAAVLAAITVGCDIACRIGLALASDPAMRGWYHPPMIGAIGAAFGAAHLLGLSPERTVAAVSLAACQFALTDELKRSPASHLRAVRDGFAARAAVDAALLARAGIAGADAPLEGPSGLFAILTGSGPAGNALSGFGTQFHGEDVAIKLWPCCRGTHRYLALALSLRDEGVTSAAIDTVAVTVRPPDDMLLLPERDRQAPATAIGAKFSIPFTFATTLLHGPPTLDSFTEGRLTDPVTRALAERVFLADVGTELDAGGRFSMRSGEVLVRAAAEPPVVTAGNVALEDLAPKFSDCLEHSATRIVVQDFLRMLESFETEGGATELRRCIRS